MEKRKNRYAAQYAGTYLEDLIDLEQANTTPTTDLTSEIEVARALCGQAVQIMSRLVTGAVDTPDGKVKGLTPKTVNQAATYVHNTLSRVAGLVERQAKIRALDQGTHDEAFLHLVVSRLTTQLQKRLLPDNPELYEQCCADMEEVAQAAATEVGKKNQVQINIT